VSDRPEWFRQAIARSDVELRETEREPPYAVTLVERDGERSVAVAVFDDRGVGSGLVNDTDGAIEWAEGFIEEWWSGATVVSPSER
jgi:hypothetical protein